jgi:zinc transport system ATP-binding protein
LTELGNYFLKVTELTVELQNKMIVEKVSFQIRKGTMLAIIGPNGAGKTVLFRTLLNLVPHTGRIEWAEKPRIGYVPQNISVKDVPTSVKEFLTYKREFDVRDLLAKVKLEPDIANKTLSILSGGQLRRVLVAFALIDDPNTLLLDEPTAGVDIGGEESIFQTLKELKQKTNITTLIITHDVHLVKEYTDQMLGLNGCMTFFGDSQQIADLSLQERIFGERICFAL